MNFEDLTDYKVLYEIYQRKTLLGSNEIYFLDELQHVHQYEKVVDSLLLKEKCDAYLTGFNAYFLSGELATLLTRRYVELSMMVLSFDEFCKGRTEEKRPLRQLFYHYLLTGSFPYVLKHAYREVEAKEYMMGNYHTILLNDVVKRLKIGDANMLEAIANFLLHNIGI